MASQQDELFTESTTFLSAIIFMSGVTITHASPKKDCAIIVPMNRKKPPLNDINTIFTGITIHDSVFT